MGASKVGGEWSLPLLCGNACADSGRDVQVYMKGHVAEFLGPPAGELDFAAASSETGSAVYRTHDNGGLPFCVVVRTGAHRVSIFDNYSNRFL
jgi:hypothetical protein